MKKPLRGMRLAEFTHLVERCKIREKEGRSGKMEFKVLETNCCNQKGEKVLIRRSTTLERL